ncbi:MAG: S8 family serine peptidase [Candidatus Solibacter usitatus]|nr:S8 family serine peptidase [Candidatus Solibacter usitatus]
MKLHVDNQEAQKIRVVRKKGGRRWLIELPEVIVKFRPSVTAVAVAAYFKKHYDVDWEELGEPGRYLVRVKNPIETLALSNALNFTRALVEYAEPNFGYFKPTGGGPVEHPKWPPKLTAPAGVRFPDDPGFPSQWALWNRPDQALPHAKSGADIRFQPLWQQSVAGLAQVRVAVLDFAVDVEHPDLKPSIDANGIYDAVRNVRGKLSPSPPDSRPDADHGTACAGIIGAVINNQIGVSGIVQNVKLLPIQMAIIDTQTGGTVISASSIDRALTAAVSMQADVINFSWGTTAELEAEDSQAVKDAIARTAQGRGQKGILFVASAGNNAKFMGPEFPASLDADDNNVLAVGASNWCDEIKTAASCDGEQDWSSQTMLGNTILVPGVRILTTSSVRNPQDANDPRNYRANFNGSSAASPFATAVAALILSAHPELTAIQVKKRLWDTADELAPGKPYRRLNACRALGLAACAAASPTGRLVPSLPAADRV